MLSLKIGGNQPELCPEGTYVGRCIRVVDMGTQPSSYNGETRDRRLVSLTWEILDENTHKSDGDVFMLSRRFTLSLHEKSALYNLISTWVGRLVDGADFPLTKLAGMYGLVVVTHTASGEKTFANISSVVPLPKGTPKPGPVHDTLVYSVSESDDDVLAQLPEKMQEAIRTSPEYRTRSSGPPRLPPHAGGRYEVRADPDGRS